MRRALGWCSQRAPPSARSSPVGWRVTDRCRSPPSGAPPRPSTSTRARHRASSFRRMSPVPSAVRQAVVNSTLAELFAADPGRAGRFVVDAGDLHIDYSKQPIDEPLMAALLEWASALHVADRRDAMFRGERINVSENKPALHGALRAPRGAGVGGDGAH